MVRHRPFRLVTALVLLCTTIPCQADTSSGESSEHNALRSAGGHEASSQPQSRDEESVASNSVGLDSSWPPWPWHHNNDTSKNSTDPDDTGGGGGGGHHWPWPWPHHNDTKKKNNTDPDDNGRGGGGGDDNGGGGDDPDNHPDDDKTKNKTDTSCVSHKSCKECASSSWGCHWCAHDEACHPIGSVHGCLAGVNCYSEDRCTRKDPEPIDGYAWNDVGTMPLIIILSVAGFIICCATCCLGGACCMRGTYEDYAALAVANAGDSVWVGEEVGGGGGGDLDLRKRTVAFDDPNVDGAIDNDGDKNEGTEYHRLIDDDNSEDEESLHTRITLARSQVMSRSSNTKCMFNTCKICYAVTVFVVAALAVVGIVYSPKRPDVNVCSDAVAWKSIVDGMTSLKMQASFQILMSVQNPNKLDVLINMASGNFNHDGAHVGTFTVPPTTIEAMAITDILVSVTFTPDKWEALQLSAEYYKGTLTFMVDMEAAIKIPALGGYTFDFKFDNYKVLANDPKLQDRHLCYCQDKNGEMYKDRPAIAAAAAELFPIADH